MPLLPTIGRVVGTGIRSVRAVARGTVRGGAWMTRRVGAARTKGAAGETGMVRLFDLHAAACAGDALIAIGLAGTIFFNVPLGEARSRVALYLLITMVPFALLAPVVGPLLDHFRHGRRYALAATMLGRAFLAWMISDNLDTFGLYPAAFGVLALSRAYGVARAAAVPRLLPEAVGLSLVNARASLYGTFAAGVVAPLGLAAFWIGPQWPLRIASVIFLVAMVVALRLPPRADSEPPEEVPAPFKVVLRLRRPPEDRPIAGSLVVAALVNSAGLRAMYGFLLLFLAFAVRAGDLSTTVLGRPVGDQGAVAVVGGGLVVGSFLATAIGTRLRIRRPAALQTAGILVVAVVGVLTTLFFSLLTVALFCLVTATVAGIAKLAVDACLQERVPERLRASAFAHSETVLMLAFVAGGGLGLLPVNGQIGVAALAGLAVLLAARATFVAGRLRREKLHGRPEEDPTVDTAATGPARPGREPGGAAPAHPRREPGDEPITEPVTVSFGKPPAGEPTGKPTAAGRPADDTTLAPPGFHIYRPTSGGGDRAGGESRTGRDTT